MYLSHGVCLTPIRMYRQQVCDINPYRILVTRGYYTFAIEFWLDSTHPMA